MWYHYHQFGLHPLYFSLSPKTGVGEFLQHYGIATCTTILTSVSVAIVVTTAGTIAVLIYKRK